LISNIFLNGICTLNIWEPGDPTKELLKALEMVPTMIPIEFGAFYWKEAMVWMCFDGEIPKFSPDICVRNPCNAWLVSWRHDVVVQGFEEGR